MELDKDAVNLAKAIRQTESGGNFTARGKSGEYGAYQYTPVTWDTYSKKHGVNVPLEQATPEQQNEVAYKQIKEWKDQGYNPGQISSMWNSGKSDAYLDSSYKGVNKSGVNYDVPKYAESVARAYQTIKQGGQAHVDTNNPSSVGSTYTPPKQSFFQEATGDISNALSNTSEAVGKASSGQINPLSGVLQTGGALAGGINQLTNTALEHLPVVGGLVKKTEELVGKGAEKVLNTDIGQKGLVKVKEFSQKHPELSKDIESGIDIATAIPLLKGLGTIKSAASGGIKKALVGSIDDVVEMVGPKLTAKELAGEVAQRGTSKKGLLGKIDVNVNPATEELAQIVKTNVPKFDSSKGFIYNINQTQKVVDDMVESLKKDVVEAGQDRIYSFKELGAKLNNVEKPIMISSDKVLDNAYDQVVKKAIQIAKKQGGKVSNLLETQKEFDGFIRQQFPNLYNSDTLTPMRQAIKNVRKGLADFTADNLPDGFGFKERRLTQHHLINAIENMAEKAVKGTTKEIGTTAISRFGQRHPGVTGFIKGGAKAAAEGVGIGKMLDIIQ